MREIKVGDYIVLKTGSVAKVLEIYRLFGKGMHVRMRVFTIKKYCYQHTRALGNQSWVKRIINAEKILRALSELLEEEKMKYANKS